MNVALISIALSSILALYDFGAPPKLIQHTYELEAKVQSPINLIDRQTQKVDILDLEITTKNWTEHVGNEEYDFKLIPIIVLIRGLQGIMCRTLLSSKLKFRGLVSPNVWTNTYSLTRRTGMGVICSLGFSVERMCPLSHLSMFECIDILV